MSRSPKEMLGDLLLLSWFVVATIGGVWMIQRLPEFISDFATVFLPAFIVLLVAMIFLGRFIIESMFNSVFSSEAEATVFEFENGLATSTSVAVVVVCAATAGAINVSVVTAGDLISASGEFGVVVEETEDASNPSASDDSNILAA